MKKDSKIYIAGHKGMVGSGIERKLRSEGFNHIITRTSKELDLRNQEAVNKFFEEEKITKIGLIQIISLLPSSYPGHSIITEDQGSLYGIDNCKCGRSGKYFKVHGRIPKSEIRGCGNIDDY